MKQIQLLLAIHNHQPVGNFDWVFSDAIKLCYEPFIDVLMCHPKVRLALHHTGPLLEWIEKNKPQYFKKIKKLSDRDQIEILGGAFYEPLISTLPVRDAIGQIKMMSDYLYKKFEKKPQGMWLAERVWEPQLASIIKQCGIDYTLLDDTHFYYAGLREENMFGFYTTENEGETLSVFPINKHLRYLIPFNTPEKAIEFLRSASSDKQSKSITLGDDGEKFGLWPGTHNWVFKEKYLDRLFGYFEDNADWMTTNTFGQYLRQHTSIGRIYLPNASYEEMMEWSLPTQTQKVYESTINELKSRGQFEQLKPFLRGGFWRNFFSKYDESNRMHKKMIHVSGLVSKMPEHSPHKKEALKELWQGQCNCPYWHGLFGGLYLNNLRNANYSHIIQAENIAFKHSEKAGECLNIVEKDYNCDGKNELLLTGKDISLYIQPAYGGSICELDYRPKLFNLCNVLTRREEIYHEKILKTEKNKIYTKEKGLNHYLFYDWYIRNSFLDHFIKPDTHLDNFYRCQFMEEGDFVNQPYLLEKIRKDKDLTSIILKRQGKIYRDESSPYPLLVSKTFSFSQKTPSSFKVEYQLTPLCHDPKEIWMGVELNFNLLSGNDKNRFYSFKSAPDHKILPGTKGEQFNCKNVLLTNQEELFSLNIDVQNSCDIIWYFPIETISQSESGFDRTYQGSSMTFIWKINLANSKPWHSYFDFSFQNL